MARAAGGQEEAIVIRVLDGFSAESESRGRLPIKNRKACGLLAYLALSPHGVETRERLAGLLWSDRSEEQARASLRQCLKQIRNVFDDIGYNGFQSERQEVLLDLASTRVDLKEAASRLRQGQVADELLAGQIDPDHILYGFDSLDSAFFTWLHVLRRQWRDNFVEQLQTILRNEDCDRHERILAAETLVKVDPIHEEAHRFLIGHFADTGNLGGALRQYSTLWTRLDEEYDMEPSAETQDLIVKVKSQAGRREAAPLAQTLPGLADEGAGADALSPADPASKVEKRLVLVLAPFQSEGVDPEKLYIVNGFRHEMLASLIRFREWIVVEQHDRPSDPAPGPYKILSYLVEATALESKHRLDLVITLKDRETGYYVWSDRFSLDLDEWSSSLRFVVRRIAVALNVQISTERIAQASKSSDLSADLYDRWLRAQELYFKWRPQDSDEAAGIIESIIADAPDFARAYTILVQIQNSRHIIFPGIHRTRERETRALSLAQKAVDLDPVESRGHLCLGWSYALNGHFEQAQLNYQLAHELNENDPWTLVSAAHGLAFCGQKQVALDLADQALRLGLGVSALHWCYQAGIRFLCEDYEGCVRAADLAEDVIYDMPGWKTAALSHAGRLREAAEEGQRFLALIRENWCGEQPAEDEAISRWLLHCFPFRHKADWERLRSGLRLADVPVPADGGAFVRP